MAATTRRLALFAILFLALAAQARASSVTVAWDPNPEPNVRYVVYWGTGSRAYTSSAAAGTATSFVVTNLTANQTYYFAVQATTVDGLASPYSEEVRATIPPTVTTRAVPGDFTGDGRARATVFRRSTGEWYINGAAGTRWGVAGDIPVPGDYDGDGKVDVAIYRPSTGTWWLLVSSTGGYGTMQWGNPGSADVPVPGDYDGDGRTDAAIYRPETGVWWILKSTGGYRTVTWGNAGSHDKPVPADYDGDGRTDVAIFRPEDGNWWLLKSSDDFNYASARTVQWGMATENDTPVPADYDGDGKVDIAVWRPTSGYWFILRSTQDYNRSTPLMVQWGVGSLRDVPVPADFDGDHKADLGIFRPDSATWYIRRSQGDYSGYSAFQWGNISLGDVPVLFGAIDPALFLR